MKIVTLIENTSASEAYEYEHGLSIYIETKNRKILMDTGASDAFLKNADRMGLDLTKVDMLILSHGHYDHTGGVLHFVKRNPNAKIYMRPDAKKEFYHLHQNGAKYIGMDERIGELSQIVHTKAYETLDQGITLFSDIQGRRLWPQGNLRLKCLENGLYEQDTFDHEQVLVIQEDGKSILLSGCAHNGILNILDKYFEIYGSAPDMVISGFHMKKNTPLTEAEKAVVRETAAELKTMKNTIFYSGHCTGEEAFSIMKEIMGEQLCALHSGKCIV